VVAPLIASEAPGVQGSGRRRAVAALAVALVLVLGPVLKGASLYLGAARSGGAAETTPVTAAGAATSTVRIRAGQPSSLDPAAVGDVGSAQYVAQLFETLTAYDSSLTLRPALARSWDVSAGGQEVTFHLRSGLTFSDGTPLTADDVVRSWLRIIDPTRPSELASLMGDVRGADAHLSGADNDPGHVGLRAIGLDVVVTLERPGADFPAIVASPTFAIVPPTIDRPGALEPAGFVGSGAYVLSDASASQFILTANPRFWAGEPSVRTLVFVSDIGGRSPVTAFEDGDLDYTQIAAYDAGWIAYDPGLGPQLRTVPSLSLQYIGFRADQRPFDDPLVRRAFGAAVDWQRIVELGGGGVDVPATSMVPPGIPGAPPGDWLPAHDPDAARALLSQAGYPGGSGFPTVILGTGGFGYAPAIATDLRRELGVTVRVEYYDDYFSRLSADPPDIWTMGWVADYPSPNDFLGVLLRTGSTNNYGRWSSSAFDAAVDAALSGGAGGGGSSWSDVLRIVQADAPVIPIAYGDGWALSRIGLLGAGQNGLGILRGAGLAWAGQ
jgi:oligopeptide transport system substrate-binding protein